MGYDRNDYWRECIECALDEAGLAATAEQIATIADVVSGGHDNIGQAFYSPPAGEYLSSENERLLRELKSERDKVGCQQCRGTGRLEYNSGPWGVNTQCDRCHGEGKHKP